MSSNENSTITKQEKEKQKQLAKEEKEKQKQLAKEEKKKKLHENKNKNVNEDNDEEEEEIVKKGRKAKTIEVVYLQDPPRDIIYTPAKIRVNKKFAPSKNIHTEYNGFIS